MLGEVFTMRVSWQQSETEPQHQLSFLAGNLENYFVYLFVVATCAIIGPLELLPLFSSSNFRLSVPSGSILLSN